MEGRNLVVIAHPDDETLFFAGLMLLNKQCIWDVICVTDANGEGRQVERLAEFEKACNMLDVNCLGMMNYPDVFTQRLDVKKLQLEVSSKLDKYDGVFTHGPVGEYGHPHHQDVCLAVHEAAVEKGIAAWSVAYNSKLDFVQPLDKTTYGVKLRILVEIYGKETSRFLNFLSCSYAEAFAQVELEEVRTLYKSLSEGYDFGSQLMPHHGMIKHWVCSGVYQQSIDSFFKHYFDGTSKQ